MSRSKLPGIPSILGEVFLNAVKETIEVREGTRGDPKEAFVRLADLENGNIVKVKGTGFHQDGSLDFGPIDPLIDTTIPPPPQNLVVTAGFTFIKLQWDGWTYKNHHYTEIWRNEINDRSTATFLGTSDGTFYSDPVLGGQTFYYWIRFVSLSGIKGYWNLSDGTEGITSHSVTSLLADLNTEINDSDLASFLVEGINSTFHQTDIPLAKPGGLALVTGDIWYNIGEDNQAYRFQLSATVGPIHTYYSEQNLPYSGGDWVNIQDGNIIDALNAASGAQGTADGKISTYYQNAFPSDQSVLSEGDLWVNTTDGENILHRYNEALAQGPIHTADPTAVAGDWANIQDSGIATAILNAATAQTTADNKINTWYEATDPALTWSAATKALNVGDFWVDTDDNQLYRWEAFDNNGVGDYRWKSVQDAGIQTAINDAATAQATADGKIQTFYQDDEPTTDLGEGDLWVDTNDTNMLYRYQDNGEGTFIWVSIRDGGIGTAISDAATAQTTADGKITTFFQDDAPATEDAANGDIWVDTDDGNNQYIWDANLETPAWVDIQDTAISAAQGTADGKITSYFQDDAPTGLLAIDNGDLWFDTDDGNKMYRWQDVAGTYSWVAIPDADIQQAITDAATAQTAANTAQGTADGKIQSFFQEEPPHTHDATNTAITEWDAATKALNVGDLWVDTNNANTLYRWEVIEVAGTTTYSWQSVRDAGIQTALENASTAQGTADGKITTYIGDTAPENTFDEAGNPLVVLSEGDLWIETALVTAGITATERQSNKIHRYQYTTDENGATVLDWVALPDAELAQAIADAGDAYADAGAAQTTADQKIQTFIQANPPHTHDSAGNLITEWDADTKTKNIGDFWIDTDDGSALSRWDGTQWVSVALATQAYVGDQIIQQVGFCQYIAADGTESVATAFDTKQSCEIADTNSGENESYTWNNDAALASLTHIIRSDVDTNNATITVQGQSINGLEAQYTVKIDNNGAVSGFGLASGNHICVKNGLVLESETTESACTAAGGTWSTKSQFYVNVDRFAVIHPTNDNINSPFIVDGENTYINMALIKDASIDRAKIGSVSVESLDVLGDGSFMCESLDPTSHPDRSTCEAAGYRWIPSGLSAVSANMGEVTAGIVRSPETDGAGNPSPRFKIDLNNSYLAVFDDAGMPRVRIGKLT